MQIEKEAKSGSFCQASTLSFPLQTTIFCLFWSYTYRVAIRSQEGVKKGGNERGEKRSYKHFKLLLKQSNYNAYQT